MKQNQTAHQRFEKSSQTYEQVATVQRDMAVAMVSRLVPFLKTSPRSILDVGAGTGYVAQSLWEHYPEALYLLNDLSSGMLAKASQNFPGASVELWEGDAQDLCLPSTELLVSNFCFQWFENLPQTLSKLWKNTKIMAFTSLSEATFGEWRQICALEKIPFQGHTYPPSSALEAMCLGLSPGRCQFFKETKTLTFHHSFSFLRYLYALGAGAKHKLSPSLAPGDLKKMLSYSEPFSVTYEIFMAILAKEGC
ncbi:MAG: methyltransferase domain-containing protein [Alphaproteobacteria bacterium]